MGHIHSHVHWKTLAGPRCTLLCWSRPGPRPWEGSRAWGMMEIQTPTASSDIAQASLQESPARISSSVGNKRRGARRTSWKVAPTHLGLRPTLQPLGRPGAPCRASGGGEGALDQSGQRGQAGYFRKLTLPQSQAPPGTCWVDPE